MSCYYLLCPFCGARVDLPDDEPEDLFKVVGCLECDRTFDYDPKDVQRTPTPEQL